MVHRLDDWSYMYLDQPNLELTITSNKNTYFSSFSFIFKREKLYNISREEINLVSLALSLNGSFKISLDLYFDFCS